MTESGPRISGEVGTAEAATQRQRRMEIFAFLFLTAFLMPALAVATVGSYGLGVWVYQMVAGPPGPPPQ
jgi:periplasmic nitrate reductase NapE